MDAEVLAAAGAGAVAVAAVGLLASSPSPASAALRFHGEKNAKREDEDEDEDDEDEDEDNDEGDSKGVVIATVPVLLIAALRASIASCTRFATQAFTQSSSLRSSTVPGNSYVAINKSPPLVRRNAGAGKLLCSVFVWPYVWPYVWSCVCPGVWPRGCA